MFSVPYARTEMSKKAFFHSAPYTQNMLQNDWKLNELIS